MMDVGGLMDKGGLVEAAAAIAELLVAEHCRCPDSHGYLQEALEELQYVLAETCGARSVPCENAHSASKAKG